MSHSLVIESPTWQDYRNGGFGDFVAQCSCGRYEYVSGHREGRYWHWLHRTDPASSSAHVLSLLISRPVPEDWTEPAGQPLVHPVSLDPNYTCATCSGMGTVEAYGTADGRFYSVGSRRSCPACAGTGKATREQSFASLAASKWSAAS